MSNITEQQIQPFAQLLQEDQLRGLKVRGVDCEGNRIQSLVTVKMGKKYARVDVGTSGKYMVDLNTGEIFGIKAYGVIHRGHQFGTLDTIHQWDWSGYRAEPKETASVAVQCTDPTSGRVGTFLFLGSRWSRPGARISPVFDGLTEAYAWAEQNQWKITS